jgi:hypothetical protein
MYRHKCGVLNRLFGADRPLADLEQPRTVRLYRGAIEGARRIRRRRLPDPLRHAEHHPQRACRLAAGSQTGPPARRVPQGPLGGAAHRLLAEVRAAQDRLDRRARGSPLRVLEAAQELAGIVLARDEVRLAQKVVQGGRFAVVHAVELAQRILSLSPALDGSAIAEGE